MSLPDEAQDWKSAANLRPLEVLTDCRVESSLASADAGNQYQFERTSYFTVDPDTGGGRLVLNRTVLLRDACAKIEAAEQPQPAP